MKNCETSELSLCLGGILEIWKLKQIISMSISRHAFFIKRDILTDLFVYFKEVDW
jgi:hypothetical protein